MTDQNAICQELNCTHRGRHIHGEWWDQPVKISTVIHWLSHCTNPEIRAAMADLMTDAGYEIYWNHCSKTTFWDVSSEWLVEAERSENATETNAN